ncbi:MAG: OmpA family protein [Granulosicoccus sp.]
MPTEVIKRAGIDKLIIHNTIKRSDGSALVWALIWLIGAAALCWAAVTFAMPRFEQKQKTAVVRSVFDVSKAPIGVSFKGFTATLSGEVADEEARRAIVSSLGVHTGVFSIRDRLSVAELSDDLPRIESQIQILPEQDGIDSVPVPLRLDNQLAVNGQASSESTTAGTNSKQNAHNNVDAEPVNANTDTTDSQDAITTDGKTLPSITLRVVGDTLSVTGVLSPEDDPASLIESAMNRFGVDVVSNGIVVDSATSQSGWFTAIENLVPDMASLREANLEIVDRQITLSGVAPDRQTHDAIINKALSSLGSYSIIERISIDESLQLASSTDAAGENTIPGAVGNTNQAAELKVAEEARIAAEEKAAEEERIAAEAKAAEEERIAAEAKAAEEARIAAEAKAAEEARIAAEAKAAEEARIAAEAKAAEEKRIAAEAKAAEEARIAAEAKAAEEARIAAEAKAAEEERIAAEAKAAEEERIAAEAKAAEEARIASEVKAAEEARIAAEAKAAEEARIVAEAKAAEEARIAAEAKAAEEARIAAEAKAAEEARIAAEAKAAEEERIAAEAKAAEEERIAAEAKAAEEERIAAEAKAAEEERIAAEAKAAEEARIVAEAQAAEDARIAAEAKAAEEARIAAEAKAAEEERIAAEAKVAEDPANALQDKDQQSNEELRQALADLPSLRIRFESSSNVLTEESRPVLDQIADVLMSFPDTIVSIEGHTDSTGSSEINLELSLARATAVRSYLIDRGVSVFMLRAKGFGEEIPIASNRTALGRAANRRIEFKF